MKMKKEWNARKEIALGLSDHEDIVLSDEAIQEMDTETAEIEAEQEECHRRARAARRRVRAK